MGDRTRDSEPSPQRRPRRVAGLLVTPAGSLIARPWFDRVALWSLSDWYLPASRAWAAALVSGGDLDRFMAEVPLAGLPRGAGGTTRLALRRIQHLRAAYLAVEAEWESAFFGSAEADEPRRAALADRRDRAAQALMLGRGLFANPALLRAVPRLRFEVPSRATVEARFGALADRPGDAYALTGPPPAIERSRPLRGVGATEYWLRFPSPHPVMGDTAWAHVYEPIGVENPPSLVYGHGLGVELEMLVGASAETLALVAEGVRIVRLEAPWHNRRCRPGRYGGEPFLATLPLGGLDLFAAEVREMGLLIAWCRENGSRRVAVGGTSLGALASQLVASHAHAWPQAMRPDALVLLTTSDDVGGLAFHSSLTRATGVGAALAAAGWSQDDLDRWRVLFDPRPDQPLPPEDIVVLLGRVDDVTPFHRGMALAGRWKVPPENLFLRNQGHFSAAIGLMRDPAPLRRLAQRLKAA